MSSAMSFGLQGGADIEKLALTIEPQTSNTWRGIPVLVVVLSGGFLVNAIWCLFLNLKNKTIGDYIKLTLLKFPIYSLPRLPAQSGVRSLFALKRVNLQWKKWLTSAGLC
jgi:hypothetical protein